MVEQLKEVTDSKRSGQLLERVIALKERAQLLENQMVSFCDLFKIDSKDPRTPWVDQLVRRMYDASNKQRQLEDFLSASAKQNVKFAASNAAREYQTRWTSKGNAELQQTYAELRGGGNVALAEYLKSMCEQNWFVEDALFHLEEVRRSLGLKKGTMP